MLESMLVVLYFQLLLIGTSKLNSKTEKMNNSEKGKYSALFTENEGKYKGKTISFA